MTDPITSKTLILSDLHITDDGDTLIDLDPMARLMQVMTHALDHHADAERLVLLGDLTHHGKSAQYKRLKPLLDSCPIQISLTMGNHDNRRNAAEVLGTAHFDGGFAQFAWTHGETLFLLIDSIDEDNLVVRHAGWLCGDRLAWVEKQITWTKPKRIVAMLHHPPLDTGFDGMDAINLRNGDALLDLLQAANVPVHVICGHVHRTISGHVRGMPFSILKSTCHQMPMQLGNPSSALSVDEPGAYSILLTTKDQIILHSEDVLDAPAAVAHDTHSA